MGSDRRLIKPSHEPALDIHLLNVPWLDLLDGRNWSILEIARELDRRIDCFHLLLVLLFGYIVHRGSQELSRPGLLRGLLRGWTFTASLPPA